MSQKRLKTWQKASALVPLALLSGAWTTSLTVSSTASAATKADSTLPDGTAVPTEALKDPASLSQPGSLAPGMDAGAAQSVISESSTNGIPTAALNAYQRAAQVINSADPSCNISWQLIAAIGRVESDHGRYGGNRIGDDGKSRPGIYGIPLDGSNDTARISDTDAGQYDNDQVFDRAVGPMQFIPSTWAVVGVDGDGDDARDPQDIDDAALATAVYLCSGDEDLSSTSGQRSAVYRYNHSQDYVNLVLSIMNAYVGGDYSSVPNGAAAPTVFTSSNGADVTPAKGKKHRGSDAAGSTAGDSGGSSGGGGSTGGTGGGSNDGGGNDGGGDDTVAPPEETPQDPTDTVEDTVKKTTEPVVDTIDSAAEATNFCAAQLTGITNDQTVIGKCADKVIGMTKEDAAAAIPNTLAGVLNWLGLSSLSSLP